MIFFLGAGASAPAPSFLPQPRLIQSAAFDLVAPDGAEPDRDLIVNSLPEIYHEVLLEIGGEATREIWRVLSLWESPANAPTLGAFRLGPNVVHYLVVYLSWKARVPVVTVNFDQMLERAAEDLGLRAEVGLTTKPGVDSVAIWKLHGTVEDLPSIRTTLQGITAADQTVLQRVEREFRRGTGCLIGYSGQDIDFFPFLCGWTLPEPVYWLSLELGKTAIQRYPSPFLGVDAPAEEWAREVVERLPASDALASHLKSQLGRPQPSAQAVKDCYRDLVYAQAKRAYAQAFPPESPRRALAHAMTLAALGRNADADGWADRYLAHPQTPTLACRAHLLKSAMAHEFARYADSRWHAKRAQTLARENQLRPQADEATLRVDEANRMLWVPPRLPFASSLELIRPRSLSAILSMILHAALMWRRRRLGSQRGIAPGYAELRATFEYLEHLVRLGAIPQGWIERTLPKRAGRRLGDRYWRWIEDRSYEAGYALGIGNSKKYRLRRSSPIGSTRDPFSVLDLYTLVPSPTGACIYHRDAADALAAELERMPASPSYRTNLKEIVEHCDRAVNAAREAGDPSLELKAMLGLKRIEPARTWPRDTVEELLAGIQSPAFRQFSDELIATLAP